MHRADLEQGAGHGRAAGDGVIEAHRAEHAAQHQARHRAHGDGAHRDGQGQKAHVQGAHGHAAQADGFHHQFDGHQQGQTGEHLKVHCLFVHCKILLLPFRPKTSDTAQTCPPKTGRESFLLYGQIRI